MPYLKFNLYNTVAEHVLSTLRTELGVRRFLLFYFLLFTSLLHAQTISASLDRDKIVIGEQVTLKLQASGITADYVLEGWPQLSDTLNHTEIVKRSDVDTFTVNGVITYQQTFTITSFDSGKWQLGPFILLLHNKSNNKQNKFSSQTLFLSVLSVDVSGMKDYHPMKDIVDVEVKYNWWIPVGIAAGALLFLFLLFIIIKKLRKQKPAARYSLQGTALERALQKLNYLHEQTLNSNEDIKSFHTNIDTVCREYFSEEIGMNAMQITTTEIMQRIGVYLQQPVLKKQLQQVMYMNNAVKFAKFFPAQQESMDLLQQTILSLKQIDEQIKQANRNVV